MRARCVVRSVRALALLSMAYGDLAGFNDLAESRAIKVVHAGRIGASHFLP